MPPFLFYPDPRLSLKAAPAPVNNALRETGGRLLAAAREAQAYGLAAAHIGEIAPVIVLNMTPDAPQPEYRALYNPRVLASAEETEKGAEASVSMPGVSVEISRPRWGDFAFENEAGEGEALRLEGFLARCAFHEIDQMNGLFFLIHLSRLKRDMVVKKYLRQSA